MLSRRLSIEEGIHPVHARLEELKASGKAINDLTQSNPTKAGLDYPADLVQWDKNMYEYQPDSKGILSAREAVAAYYNGVYPPDNIFLTSGTSEAYSWLMKLLCNPGDEILVPSPSYPLFAMIADLECVKTGYYQLTESNCQWSPDFDSVARAISSRTKMIVLVNPNNPTGMVLARSDIEKFLELSERHQIPLVVDEVFSDYIHSGQFVRVRAQGDMPVFTLNGISKVLGLPQMKLSWIVVDGRPEVIKKINHTLEIIADTYLSVSHIIQHSLPRLFSFREQLQNRIHGRLAANLAYLKSKNNKCILLPEAGWQLLLKLNIDDEKFIMQMMQEKAVYAYPGSMFGFGENGYIVASLLTGEEKFKAGIDLLLEGC